MKATLLLVVFAAFIAFSAAANDLKIGVPSKRCGGSSGKTCLRGEVCVGEKELKDGLGVCILKPRPCGNFFGDTCPSSTAYCMTDPRIQCPAGVMDCGGGLCVPKTLVDQIGLK